MTRGHNCSRMSERVLPSLLLDLLLGLLLIGFFCGAVEAQSTPPAAPSVSLNFQRGRLTARIIATPLQQVMEKISRLSGAQIVWLSNTADRAVSTEFTSLPLAEALRRILGEQNFLLFYTSMMDGASLTQIWISSPGQSKNQVELAKQPPSLAARTSKAEEETAAVTTEEEDASSLVEATLQAALHDQDPAKQIGAIELLASYVEEDPRAKAALSHIAHTATDRSIQEAAAEALSEGK